MESQELSIAQLRRVIIDLYKHDLIVLEDLYEEHNITLQKLQDALPNSAFPILLAADYFTVKKFNLLRKRILDAGNDAVRKMEEQLKQS